jgi:hypothetical protein
LKRIEAILAEESDMGYKSLLVNLDPGRSNANLLPFAAELAERFDARLIGITACARPIMAFASH